jgi:hypothetical protein
MTVRHVDTHIKPLRKSSVMQRFAHTQQYLNVCWNEKARDAGRRVAGCVMVMQALRERHFEANAGIVDPWCHFAASAFLEVHNAVPLHRLERARRVRLLAS